MRFILFKIENGFLERLGDSSDFRVRIDNYYFNRWNNDRHLNLKFNFNRDIITTKDEFLAFIQSPILEMMSDGITPNDRCPDITKALMNFYTIAMTHTECSHVLMTHEIKFK